MAQKKVTVTLTDAEYSSIAPIINTFQELTQEEKKRALQKIKIYLIAVVTVRSPNVADWTMEPVELTEIRIRVNLTGKITKSMYQFDLLAGTPDPEINLADDDS